MKITVDQIKQILKDTGNKFVRSHDCSLCGVDVGWMIHDVETENIWFRSGCDCGSFGDGGHDAYFSDIADWYNMQSTDKGREYVMQCIRGNQGAA